MIKKDKKSTPNPGGNKLLGFPTHLPGRFDPAPPQHQVRSDRQIGELTVRELRLLTYLAQHFGQLVPGPELVAFIMGLSVGQARAAVILQPLVYSLRTKLGPPCGFWIESIAEVGYRLTGPARQCH